MTDPAKVKEVVERVDRIAHLLCDSECGGRCFDCPADALRDFDKLLARTGQGEAEPVITDAMIDAGMSVLYAGSREGMRLILAKAFAARPSPASERAPEPRAITATNRMMLT